MELVDWKHDTGRNQYHLLINKADKNTADVAFKDFDTNASRFAGKTEREGIDISTHMLLKPQADGKTALLLVTQGGGMQASAVESVFTQLSKRLKEDGACPDLFQFSCPSGEVGKTYKVSYGFACHGHKGQTLQQDLARGKLLDIELVECVEGGLDAGGNFRVESHSVKLVPKTGAAGTLSAIMKMIPYVERTHGRTFENARIRFKDHSDKQRIETFQTNHLEVAFTRREYINFDTDLQSSYQELNSGIIEKLQEFVGQN